MKVSPKFPEVVRYEVHEVAFDGTTTGNARGKAYSIGPVEKLAEEWTAEAHERYEAEARGPVKPNPPSTFVAVKVTETREVI